MDNSTLVRVINMYCPICGKKHDLEERKRIATLLVKDERVSYEEHFCYCENASDDENEFEIGTMTNDNLFNARNAYRIKKNSRRC